MTFRDFSAQLILTRDLDPDYVYIREIAKQKNLDTPALINWAIHKIFIYDTASEYSVIFKGRNVDTMVHGSERQKAKRFTRHYLDRFLADFDINQLPREYSKARMYLKQFPGVGDWAAWKFCDLLERVCDVHIDFSQVDFRSAYKYPLRGLCAVNGEKDDFEVQLRNDQIYDRFMNNAKLALSDVLNLQAPPKLDRTINIQEIETCLCKYHSYLSGHYKIGKDTKHLNERFHRERIEIPVNLIKLHTNPLNL